MRAATFKLPRSLVFFSAKGSNEETVAGSRHSLLKKTDFPRAKESFAASEERRKKSGAGTEGSNNEQEESKASPFLLLLAVSYLLSARGLLSRRRLALSEGKGGDEKQEEAGERR